MVKGGPMFFFSDLDLGLNTELLFALHPLRFLAIEFGTGFFWADGDSGTDAWGASFFGGVGVRLPVGPVEPYAGAGIGAYYINAEFQAEDFVYVHDSDIVFGGYGVAGVNVYFGEAFLGVEGKYIRTMDADLGGQDLHLDGLAIMLCFGARF